MSQKNEENAGRGKSKNKNILEDKLVRTVLSVFLALLSWMAVTIAVKPGTSFVLTAVPVSFEYDSGAYTSHGLSIVDSPSVNVNLSISGDGYIIGDLARDDFVVYPDYSSVVSSGEKELRLRVRCLAANAGSVNVAITGSVTTAKVVFDTVDERDIPVQVQSRGLEIEEGYMLDGTSSTVAMVTLTGPRGELDRVSSCVAEVTCDEPLRQTRTLDAVLHYYDRSGEEVTFQYAKADRTTVGVVIAVYKLAELPVQINFINLPRGFDSSVLRYTLSHNKLTVYGLESTIGGMTSVPIGTIDISTFDLNKVYEMPLNLPAGVKTTNNISSIEVNFDCSHLAIKTVHLPAGCVQFKNMPLGLVGHVETERLMNVRLCGPEDALETLTVEQVVAEVDVEDFSVQQGRQNVACKLYVPSDNRIFAVGRYALPCLIENGYETENQTENEAENEEENGIGSDTQGTQTKEMQ